MTDNMKFLGQNSALPASPEQAELDYVDNPRQGETYLVRFSAPEFTSLCPVTGQPDFAHLVLDYAPGDKIVEILEIIPWIIPQSRRISRRLHSGDWQKTV